MRVAIVDDEYYALEGLKFKLSELEGVELVGQYEDSLRFLSEVIAIRPDLILLDIEMPKKNGFEVLADLREQGITAAVIFITAYSHYKERIAGTDALGYIVKPVTREELKDALIKGNEHISE